MRASPDARGSWLHHRAFRQQRVTSRLGNVRFTGVPPGRIIARIKAADGTTHTEQRALVASNQELQITLSVPPLISDVGTRFDR